MNIGTTQMDVKPFTTTISYKQASLGALLAITFGYIIFILKFYIDPILISMFNWSIIGFFSDIYIIQVSPPNPMYILELGFKFLTDIPACFGWLIGGIILGSYYKRKNTHFDGIRGSWKSFSIIIMAIEVIFIGFAFYYLITFLVGINYTPFSLFFNDLLKSLLALLLTPGFWLSITLVIIGGVMGSKFTKSIEVPSSIKKVPKIMLEAESKPEITKPEVTETIVVKPRPSIKVEKAEISVEIPSKPTIVEKVEITETEKKITNELLSTGKCPKCKTLFPAERLAIIEGGKDSYCPNCFQVFKVKAITTEIKQKKDKIREIFRDGVELLTEDKEKAIAFFQDALDLAKEINDDELIKEIEEIIRKIE